MNDIRNCEFCHSLFVYDGENDLCPECAAKEEADYMKVRHYIQDNPGSTAAQVSENTGVSRDVIFRLIRNKRLIVK